MKYTPTKVAGVTIIDFEAQRDHRGFSSRSFCSREFANHGLVFDVIQTDVVFSYTRGTVRGLHRRVPPHAEAKLVRCTRGAIATATVDVRPDSRTYGDHVMVELSADDHRALFLPPYVAHGFQTLIDDTEVSYQVSGHHPPNGEEGFRWDDPEFGIAWPLPVTVISEQDASWPYRTPWLEPVENAARTSGLHRSGWPVDPPHEGHRRLPVGVPSSLPARARSAMSHDAANVVQPGSATA